MFVIMTGVVRSIPGYHRADEIRDLCILAMVSCLRGVSLNSAKIMCMSSSGVKSTKAPESKRYVMSARLASCDLPCQHNSSLSLLL